MRVGFKILNANKTVTNACIVGNIFPPTLYTDNNGEAFAIAPMFISPAKYILDVTITCTKGISLKIQDTADEIENYYTIDLESKTWSKETLINRIGGDGYHSVDNIILKPNELIISTTDPMLKISNCFLCLYFDRLFSVCRVNGNITLPTQISNPLNTTSRLYYPFFLPPSQERINRDMERLK